MGGLGQACLLFIFFISGEKNFAGSEPRRTGGASDAEAAAAIPFPLKPLFLAAAADAVNFYEFLVK